MLTLLAKTNDVPITVIIIPVILISLLLPAFFIILPIIARRRVQAGKAHGVGYSIGNQELRIFLRGLQRFNSFRMSIAIPISSIDGARLDRQVAETGPAGMKWGGIYLPEIITAGTFKEGSHREFWYVTDPKKAVVIDIHNHKFERVVVQVDEPEKFVQEVQAKKIA